MTLVYGIPNCNTVKKAIDWLSEHNIEYEFVNYKKVEVSAEKVQEWSRHFGWENLLNKAGTTWKKLPEETRQKITTEKAAIELMQQQPSIIRRPIIEAGKKYLIRFNEVEYEAALLKS